MIDLHIHLLPGIDDGAVDLDDSVAMCRAAAEAGCTALVATPHQRHFIWSNQDIPGLERLLDEVRERSGAKIDLHLGAEVRVDSELATELEAADASICSLAGSRYLLLEYPRDGSGPDPLDLIHDLTLAGWRPILAHPEFIPSFGDDPELCERLVAAGAMLQITAMSLTGEFGRRPRAVVRRLLDAELVHFLASDAHGVDHRPPGLAEAAELVAEGWGEETARRLVLDHPAAVLADRPLPPATD